MRACHLLFLAIFLPVVWTQDPRISLATNGYVVSEEVGTLSVCAVVHVSGGTLSSRVEVTITTLSSTATSPEDYINLEEDHTFTPGGTLIKCSDIQVNSDDIVEGTEIFSAGIQSAMDILGQPTSAFIQIADKSKLTIRLNQAEYFVSEGGILRVCVVLLSGKTERDVTFRVTSGGGSASAITDYLDATREGSFPPNAVPGNEICVTFNTFLDRIVENTETFLVVLDSSDSVIITESTAIANIQDNDGVDVAWQETEITIVEGNSGEMRQTDLCFTLEDRANGIQREVRFLLTSVAGSADNSDYVPLSEVIVGFPTNPSPMVGSVICQTITIIGDDVMEENETFAVVMTPENDFDDIIGLASVTITIPADGDVLADCPPLLDPENGQVMMDGVIESSTATYSCNNGYNINGSPTRTCGSDEVWSGNEPSCQVVDCSDPPLPNNASLASTITSTTFGATVTYVCDTGFQLQGDATITCEASGSWSGAGPVCQAVDCGSLDNPVNGDVDVPQTEFPGVATYTCNTGYILSGGNTRTCQTNEMWSGVAPTCRVVTCPSLTSPPNADVRHPIGTEYQSTALYTCDSGYERGSGDLARTCGADGTWSGSEPVCAARDCGPLSAPANGEVLLSGTTFNNVAEYSCSNGYSLSGSSTRQCTSGGTWSGGSPSCIIVDCGVLGNPSNGQVQFSATTFGSEAQYMCTAGCDPVSGDSTRTCTAEGIWSGTIPQCAVISCGSLSNPSNGIVQFSSSTAGGVATYVCDAGYDVVGDSVRECQCNSQWSGSEAATCQAVDCGNLESPDNGMVTTTPATVYLSVATYECEEGHRLIGATTRMCETNGQWSGMAPRCEIVTCEFLTNIINGGVDITGIVFNSVATYTCNEGYRLNGERQRTCLSSGDWSAAEPQCLIVICDPLSSPENGGLTLMSIVYNSVALFFCDSGFNLIGTNHRRCQDTGEWTGQTPQCIEILCGPLSSPDNGNVMVSGSGVGALASYTCDTGYNMEGQTTRTCQNPGPVWSGSAPLCTIVSCGNLLNPTNGMVQLLSGATYQSTAQYSCVVGYQLSGAASVTCGANGEWSDSPPQCNIVECPELSEPEKSAIEYSAMPSVYNSRAEYRCASGYMLDGDRERVCQSSGAWSGSSPTCRPVDCGDLSDPLNGTVQLARTTFGDVAVYQCAENYTLAGQQSRICQADASWSGFEPTCVLVDCGTPPTVFFAVTPSGLVTKVGNTISYDCFGGYRLVGEQERTCQSNGEWSGETPRCERIVCPVLNSPMNGEVTVPSRIFGNSAEYRCDVGFVLAGSATRVCEGEGTWSSSAPSCHTVTCPRLMAPTNGQVAHQSLELNSVATYSCNPGYVLEGGATRLCLLDGSWGGQAPLCKPVDCGPLPSPPNGNVNAPNTVLGSQATYSCQGSGYILTGDSSRQCDTNGMWTGSQPVCENINECENANGMCEQVCLDTTGDYMCTCSSGYAPVEGNQLLCQDVNECEDGVNGGCAHTCNNYEGGFSCSCDDGYTLSPNGRDCLDINECEQGEAICALNATCSNTDGSFVCTCNIGFEGNGTSCENTDECVQSGNPCHLNAECTDTDGGFACQCLPGFEGDGHMTCQNVDECANRSLNNCHPDATCMDTEGSFTCTCKDGNAGDGINCEEQCLTNFQLVLGPVDSCLKWRFESTDAKLSDITVAIVSYLNTMCDCSLPPSHVYANEFSCSQNGAHDVIYRAKLNGVEAGDCANLTSYLQEWIDKETSISIQGNRLKIDSSCDLEIDSLMIQSACVIGETPPTTTTSTSATSDSLSIEIIIGAAVAGLIIIILLLLLILVICCICCRRTKDKNGDREKYSSLFRPFGSSRGPLAATPGYNSSVSSGPGRSVFDYNSDVDTKSSTTFEPGKMPRTPSLPLVNMTDIRRNSYRSSHSGSFSSIDPNELAYANTTMTEKVEKFDDPVYEYIKGGEQDFAHNPLYDTPRRITGHT